MAEKLAPDAQLIADLLTAVGRARQGKVPPEKIVAYLRDLAQDVAEAASN